MKGYKVKTPFEKPEIPCKQCPCYGWKCVFQPRFNTNEPFFDRRRKAPNLDLLIVGEAPGTQELIANSPFVGPSGRMLRLFLRAAQIEALFYAITNACRCSTGSSIEQKPPQDAFDLCIFNLIQELKHYKPKNVIVLGKSALSALIVAESNFTPLAYKISPRLKITELDWQKFVFKSEITKRRMVLISTVHPAYILRSGQTDMIAIAESRWARLKELLI